MRTTAGAGQAARTSTRRDPATAQRYPPMARRLLKIELDGKSRSVMLHIIYYRLACFVLIFIPNPVEASVRVPNDRDNHDLIQANIYEAMERSESRHDSLFARARACVRVCA